MLIFGADFSNPEVTDVTFGGLSSNFTVDVDDLVTAVSPAGTGTVDIEVTNADGTTAAGSFQYAPTPADVVYLDPSSGSVVGGTVVTITGTGFLSVTQVAFDASPATQFTINSDSEIVATSPPGIGIVDVGVVNAAGHSSTEPFTYVPLVTGVVPNSGASVGGEQVSITGQGFDTTNSVEFGGASAAFTVHSDTEIEATTPPGQDDVHVVVVTADGPSPMTQDGVFVFIA